MCKVRKVVAAPGQTRLTSESALVALSLSVILSRIGLQISFLASSTNFIDRTEMLATAFTFAIEQ
jgi:hypothetical protein